MSRPERIQRLTLRLADGLITDAEQAELEQSINSDPEAMRIYLLLLDQEAALRSFHRPDHPELPAERRAAPTEQAVLDSIRRQGISHPLFTQDGAVNMLDRGAPPTFTQAFQHSEPPTTPPADAAPPPSQVLSTRRSMQPPTPAKVLPDIEDEGVAIELRVYLGQNLLDIRHYYQPQQILIGDNVRRADIFTTSQGLPSDAFPLVRYSEGGYQLCLVEGMRGELQMGGATHQVRELVEHKAGRSDAATGGIIIELNEQDRGIVRWGGITVAIRFTNPVKRIKSAPFKQLDLRYITTAAVSFAVHLVMILTFQFFPFEVSSLDEDLFNEPDRWGKLILNPPSESKETEDLLKKIKDKAKKKKEEKKEVKEKPDPNKKVVKKKVTREAKKERVAKKFEKLFDSSDDGGGLLGGGGGGSLSGSLSNVIGTMGAGSATAGLAGLGIRGSGPMTGGGVGTSKGIGGIGLLGGGGKGAKYKVGVGSKKQVKISFSAGPTVTGGLTKKDIKKVIRKNRNQIRYCYELGLTTNKNLEGRVKINWIINAQGGVISASVASSDLPAKQVEQCIVAKIRRWKFPAPKGGGIVEVNYPFIFKTS